MRWAPGVLAIALLGIWSPARAAAVADPAEPPDTSAVVLTIVGLSGATLDVTSNMLGQLPSSTLADQPVEGSAVSSYNGKLLWSVLQKAGAVPPAAREQASEAVLVSGAAGTTSLLALAEISPMFEGKPVILADHQDGQPIADGVSLVVPSDHRPARSITNVTRIAIVSP